MTYTNSGAYTATLTNAAGCDSIVTLNLTINTVDPGVSQNGFVLSADQTGATYQWTDCNNNYSPIVGETNIDFSPSANGSYAVIISSNGCSDTSGCIVISTIGIHEIQSEDRFIVYPNPTSGNISIDLPSRNGKVTLRIINALGQIKFNRTFTSEEDLNLSIDAESGFYVIEIETENGEVLKSSFVKTQ
jgi:hypothetical protein